MVDRLAPKNSLQPNMLRNVAKCRHGCRQVEGHVPVESLKKLLAEGRHIKGIALLGMPPGAPGMGPMKAGTLTVYEIPKAGEPARVFSVE